MTEPKMKIRRDYSKKSSAALRKMLEKDSGATAAEARAAYKELEKREGDLGFTVTMILGGRKAGDDEIVMPTKKPKMAKGGYANCGASMPATQKSTKMMKGGYARKK